MSLNDTPSGERLHIGFFGMRNAGKSSLVNAVTGHIRNVSSVPKTQALQVMPHIRQDRISVRFQ